MGNRFAVKIRDDVNIVSRAPGQFSFRVNLLQIFPFGIEAVSNDGHDHAAERREDTLLKIDHRDQPEFLVAIILVRHTIAQGLGFCLVRSGHDRNDRDMAIGGRKLTPIYIGKGELINISYAQVGGLERGCGQQGEEEKILPQAEVHA